MTTARRRFSPDNPPGMLDPVRFLERIREWSGRGEYSRTTCAHHFALGYREMALREARRATIADLGNRIGMEFVPLLLRREGLQGQIYEDEALTIEVELRNLGFSLDDDVDLVAALDDVPSLLMRASQILNDCELTRTSESAWGRVLTGDDARPISLAEMRCILAGMGVDGRTDLQAQVVGGETVLALLLADLETDLSPRQVLDDALVHAAATSAALTAEDPRRAHRMSKRLVAAAAALELQLRAFLLVVFVFASLATPFPSSAGVGWGTGPGGGGLCRIVWRIAPRPTFSMVALACGRSPVTNPDRVREVRR